MKKTLNGFHLKCITLLLMIGGLVSQQSVIYLAAFPLAAFLLVEAAVHTKNKKNFLFRLLFAAFLTEIPMDIAAYGFEVNRWMECQNYFFTLLLGFLAICVMELLAKKYPAGNFAYNMLALPVYLLAVAVALFGRAEQGSIGILLILALYSFRGNKLFSLVSAAALYIIFMGNAGGLEYVPAISLLLTWLYDGTPGLNSLATRLFTYGAYPVVFCVLRMVVQLM